jgi:hypothetical protein
MPRKLSSIAPDWWDYTTLDDAIIRDAAALMPERMLKLSRPGFKVVFYDTLAEFYLIAKKLADATVPMSLLAGHLNVQFNYYRQGIANCGVEMH